MSKIGKRLFKMINDEIIFGDVEVVTNNGGVGEFLIRNPYTAINGNIMQYCVKDLTQAPAAIQIHPMNVIWQTPLDEFSEAYRVYMEQTTGIVTDSKSKIVI